MTAMTDTAGARRPSVMAGLGITVLALAFALAILAVGTKALVALIGALVFVLMLRNPMVGLYVTTALLLLSGTGSNIGAFAGGVPVTGAKLVGIATIAAWLLNALTTGKRFYTGTPVVLALVFTGWAAVGIALSLAWRAQWPEWTRLLTVVGYFILAIHLLNTRERIHRFVVLILVCGAAMSAFAVAQYFVPALQAGGVSGIQSIAGGGEFAYVDPEGLSSGAAVRVSGLTGHSNWLAFALLLMLPLNVYWFSTVKSLRAKLFISLCALLEIAALVLTFTRLGLLVGVLVAVALVVKGLVHVNPYRIVALAVVLVFGWVLLPGAYKERVLDFSGYSGSESTSARLELQEYAWQYMRDFPTAGIGLGGFGLKFYDENSRYSAMLRWMNKELGWNPVYYGPHNMYLQVGSEAGAVGLFLMILMMLVALKNAQKSQRLFKEAGDSNMALLAGTVFVSLIAFVCCAVFLHALHQKIWWMVMALSAALPLYAATLKSPAKNGANGNSANGAAPAAQP
ncbi:MAG: O-antigen ligase family protein [Candidatus Hydrogenedentes bacterium]|nr:O-antigen ligase family protein [Candidatus Hydrogenedentota bacterium]